MTFFEDSRQRGEPPAPLAAEVVTYYRRMLVTHADDLTAGACPVCQVARCADWRDAFDKLARAGEVMAEPGRVGEVEPMSSTTSNLGAVHTAPPGRNRRDAARTGTAAGASAPLASR